MTRSPDEARTITALLALAAGLMILPTAGSAAGEYKATCYDGEAFQVVARDRYGVVGMDIAYRPRKPGTDRGGCDWSIGRHDVWVSENRGDRSEDANYVVGVKEPFILMDVGTAPAPDRGFVIYDMRSRKIVLTAGVSEDVAIEADRAVLWIRSGKPPARTCSNQKEIDREIGAPRAGSAPAIGVAVKHTFDFRRGSLVKTEEAKCYVES